MPDPLDHADSNRCAYREGSRRCAYLARWFPNVTEQRKDAHPEHGLCIGHAYHGGSPILDASLAAVPIDFDYRTPALVEISIQSYLGGAAAREPGQEG
jgi:hypothetical protein